MGEVAIAFNALIEENEALVDELRRVDRSVGFEGKTTERASLAASGSWTVAVDAVNSLVEKMAWPVREATSVLGLVANGDLSRDMSLHMDGTPLEGDFRELGTTVKTVVGRLRTVSTGVSRVVREMGTEGKLGGHASVEGLSGNWKDLVDDVNLLAGNLTAQVRNIALVTTAVANGDLSRKITVEAKGEILELTNTINTMTDSLRTFADQVSTVAREVGIEGKLGGQAKVPGVAGTWRELTDNVNLLAGNLTNQVRNIALDHHRRRQRRPLAENHGGGEGRDPRAEGHHQRDGRTSSAPLQARSPASLEKSVRTASSVGRPRSRESRAPGKISPTTST